MTAAAAARAPLPTGEYPRPFRSWFRSADAARRLRKVMGGLRVPPGGSYGRFKIRYAYPRRLDWFDDPGLDRGFLQDKWIIPHLFGPGNVMWMSWHPLEVLTVWRDARRFPGGRRILVAGLGLGVFQQLVESRYEEVWTIDLDAGMAPPLFRLLREDNWRLVVGDAYRFTKIFRKGAFDAAYFDIWKDFPGESYRRLHRALNDVARLHGIRRSRCWAQDLAGMRLPEPDPLGGLFSTG